MPYAVRIGAESERKESTESSDGSKSAASKTKDSALSKPLDMRLIVGGAAGLFIVALLIWFVLGRGGENPEQQQLSFPAGAAGPPIPGPAGSPPASRSPGGMGPAGPIIPGPPAGGPPAGGGAPIPGSPGIR